MNGNALLALTALLAIASGQYDASVMPCPDQSHLPRIDSLLESVRRAQEVITSGQRRYLCDQTVEVTHQVANSDAHATDAAGTRHSL